MSFSSSVSRGVFSSPVLLLLGSLLSFLLLASCLFTSLPPLPSLALLLLPFSFFVDLFTSSLLRVHSGTSPSIYLSVCLPPPFPFICAFSWFMHNVAPLWPLAVFFSFWRLFPWFDCSQSKRRFFCQRLVCVFLNLWLNVLKTCGTWEIHLHMFCFFFCPSTDACFVTRFSVIFSSGILCLVFRQYLM